eukprot:m.21766 g.21766  ORF g.21766 m.21766 type:complete len:336 (+) comp28216_c0_seq1:1120-2127(+)
MFHRVAFLTFCGLLLMPACSAETPSVKLQNAAKPELQMPAVGLGTAGYIAVPERKAELWNDSVAEKAVTEWLKAGGRRIDTAIDYNDQKGIGKAIREQSIPRSDIFIVSKVGGGPLGYNETLNQFQTILSQLNTTYVDLLLIHWPVPMPSTSSDPSCQQGAQARDCRQSSWKAMERIFTLGSALAIGVSNFEKSHLQDIVDMHGLLPAVNQVEYHPYWHEDDLVAFCRELDIAFNTYSPLGTPDWAPDHRGWNSSILELPVIKRIAESHRKSPAQIVLRWAWEKGLLLNPRSWNSSHMTENLSIFDFELNKDDIQQIENIPKPENPKICPYPKTV